MNPTRVIEDLNYFINEASEGFLIHFALAQVGLKESLLGVYEDFTFGLSA